MFLDGKAYHAIGQEKTEENKLRPEELSNWVCFNDTEQMRETYLKMFEVSPTLTNNMRSLMLSFLSLVPPLRLNYHDMIVYRKKTPPPEGLFNYIWEYEQGKWKYVIGNDKITYKERLKPNYKRTILTLSDEIEGITDGARLNNILTQSFAVHPRTYLLTPTRILDSDKPMTEQTYKCALATIFKPKKPTCNIFRKSYVNYYYPTLNTAQQNQIAKRMRHTKDVALSSYRKLNIPEECTTYDGKSKKIITDVDIELSGRDLPPPPVKAPIVKTAYFNAKESSKKYRESNKDKITIQRKDYYTKNKDQILRKKILWMLNISQSVDKPSRASVEKYGIRYDTELKKWV
jgi:hypothetical protein